MEFSAILARPGTGVNCAAEILGRPSPGRLAYCEVGLLYLHETKVSLKLPHPCEEQSPMSLSPVQMDSVIDEHFACEASDNVEGGLATLSLDVEHDAARSPPGPPRGR